MRITRLARGPRIALFALIGVAFVAVFGLVLMSLWNWLMPALFGWKLITLWEALGLLILTRILFGGVNAAVPLGFTATALPIAIFAGLIPITLGGMGTRDTAMVVLFAAYASSSQALAVALLYSFFGYWLLAVVGIPYIRKALNL